MPQSELMNLKKDHQTNISWLDECQRIAAGIRRRVLRHTIRHGGYLSQACSSAEIFSLIYGHAMKLGPSEGPFIPQSHLKLQPGNNASKNSGMLYNGQKAPGLDRFFLSPTHYALTLYSTLIETGRLGESSLDQFNVDGSPLEMIGSEHSPGHETNGGSFGQTISQAAGVAWARRKKGDTGKVWVFLSDGECQEGQTWEAVLSLAFHKISNIKIIVDVNGQQVDGRTSEVMNLEPLREKFTAFGAKVEQVDGHDLQKMNIALQQEHVDKPFILLARTSPYQGMEILKERYPFLHYVRFKDDAERDRYKQQLNRLEG